MLVEEPRWSFDCRDSVRECIDFIRIPLPPGWETFSFLFCFFLINLCHHFLSHMLIYTESEYKGKSEDSQNITGKMEGYVVHMLNGEDLLYQDKDYISYKVAIVAFIVSTLHSMAEWVNRPSRKVLMMHEPFVVHVT